MLKKGYIIIALTIVSVLLGSLFYNNMTQAQKLHVYKDSTEIIVLDTSRFWYQLTSMSSGQGYDKGLWVSPNDYGDTILPFVFTPKHLFLNISDLWITIIASSYVLGGGYHALNITLNEEVTVSTSFSLYPSASEFKELGVHIEDPNIYQTITIGINTLKLEPFIKTYEGISPATMYVFKGTIFIEYEYQAR